MNNIKYIYLLLSIILLCIITLKIFYYLLFINIDPELVKINRIRLLKFIKTLDTTIDTKFIIPHLELGDNLIINGLIRHYLENSNVVLVCKYNYKIQLEHMYSDLLNNINNNKIYLYDINGGNIEKINIYNELPIDYNIKKYFKQNNIDLIIFNAYNLYYNKIFIYNPNYPSYLYTNLNIDENIQYSKFKIVRNYEKEDKLYQELVKIIGSKYVIIIEDRKRNLIINRKYIKTKLPIFSIGLNANNKNKKLDNIRDSNIFNYIKIFENASQIHSIDSCMILLIDMLSIKGKIYAHSYVRKILFYNSVKYQNPDIRYIKDNNIFNIKLYEKI